MTAQRQRLHIKALVAIVANVARPRAEPVTRLGGNAARKVLGALVARKMDEEVARVTSASASSSPLA